MTGWGIRNGYVKLTKDHPWNDILSKANAKNEILYTSIPYLDVHGGITFACKDTVDNCYWLAFDCNHDGDAPDFTLIKDPEIAKILKALNDDIINLNHHQTHNWTTKEVEIECQALIEQVALYSGLPLKDFSKYKWLDVRSEDLYRELCHDLIHL